MAASVPLFPCLPPDRSIACCIVLSVSTPKITGLLYLSDTSFMPVIGNTKVMAQTLDDTYEQLLKLFKEEL